MVVQQKASVYRVCVYAILSLAFQMWLTIRWSPVDLVVQLLHIHPYEWITIHEWKFPLSIFFMNEIYLVNNKVLWLFSVCDVWEGFSIAASRHPSVPVGYLRQSPKAKWAPANIALNLYGVNFRPKKLSHANFHCACYFRPVVTKRSWPGKDFISDCQILRGMLRLTPKPPMHLISQQSLWHYQIGKLKWVLKTCYSPTFYLSS